MDKSRKRSLTRVKSPAGRKTNAAKTPARSRSKSGGQVKKEPKSRARSKSRTKKDQRSRSRGRAKSKSPAPRTRSRSRRSTSRSRASSRSVRAEYSPAPVLPDKNSVEEREDHKTYNTRRLNLVLKDLYHDDYIQDSLYTNVIRRSLSKESTHENNSLITRRYPNFVRQESEQKELDGIGKDIPPPSVPRISPSVSHRPPSVSHIPPSASHIRISSVPKKKMSFVFHIPKFFKIIFGIFFFPALVLLLHLACTKEQCTLSKFHIHRNLNLYFNLNSALIVLVFIAVQTLLSLLSIGKRVGGPPGINGTLMYRCNGLLSTFISAGLVAVLWYYKYPVTIVYERMISLIVATIGISYIFSVLLFIQGGRASLPSLNPSAMNENRFYQFVLGRETNPFLFGKINVKTLLLRVSLNALVIFNGLLLLRAYLVKPELNYTLIVCVALSTFLVVDFFWFEDSFPSTFEAMYEGTGCYLTTSYMLFPFFPTVITKYIIHHKVEVPVYGLAAIVAFYLIGYFIYRASNLQKAAFRRNPLNPALAHFETISTGRGKKLLVTSWWGFVRHPNYLGNIILHWAWASTAGYTHAIPFTFPLLMTLVLMNRARRVDAFCKERYQTSWDEYCNRVPRRIIPRIY